MTATPTKPAFVIGITGYMDIPDQDRPVVGNRLQEIFRWLRRDPSPAAAVQVDPPAWWPAIGKPNSTGASPDAGLGLGDHPMILLTSLAPGADTIAAQRAFHEGIRVVAPLPFPAEIYRRSSTFCGDQVPAGSQRQFDDLIGSATHPIDAFPVMLHTDLELQADTRNEGFNADLEDSERCNLRFRAAGEFVATHCHLLIAVYSATDDLAGGLETGAGTASIVRVRRSVPTVRMNPRTDGFPLVESGPVFHLPARSLKRIADPTTIAGDNSWQSIPARFLPAWPAADVPSDPATPPDPAAAAKALSELRIIAHGLAH